eukprot:TRINITY_DN8929_c0_g3_i1.p2 TRINITY_DN8929_c0_g3~~TRINITY_DN8929_c0_g3_i1.p2  ORF type:complete len:112 (+),score=15.00 TRINITY_DN8929_c0_g3_i1:415-750(+)
MGLVVWGRSSALAEKVRCLLILPVPSIPKKRRESVWQELRMTTWSVNFPPRSKTWIALVASFDASPPFPPSSSSLVVASLIESLDATLGTAPWDPLGEMWHSTGPSTRSKW